LLIAPAFQEKSPDIQQYWKLLSTVDLNVSPPSRNRVFSSRPSHFFLHFFPAACKGGSFGRWDWIEVAFFLCAPPSLRNPPALFCIVSFKSPPVPAALYFDFRAFCAPVVVPVVVISVVFPHEPFVLFSGVNLLSDFMLKLYPFSKTRFSFPFFRLTI